MPAAVATALASAAACGPAGGKLDEATFYEGRHFRLKLVRYFENLPLHYTGEVFRVHCASAGTANSPAHKTQDAGWVTLANGGAIGSKSAARLAERERRNYAVVDDRTLAWIGNGVNVSFDACATVRGWYLKSVPPELIVPAAKPDFCAQPKVDCSHLDFVGDRAARFTDLQVDPQGSVSFVVHSRAFRNAGAISVHSPDSGRTWKVEPL